MRRRLSTLFGKRRRRLKSPACATYVQSESQVRCFYSSFCFGLLALQPFLFSDSLSSEIEENQQQPQGTMDNVIKNHDFSQGLAFWHPNSCDARVCSLDDQNSAPNSFQRYAIVTNRTQCWQGLEQDITCSISPGSKYVLSAQVMLGQTPQGAHHIQATLKLIYDHSPTQYLFLGRILVSDQKWEQLDGTFTLTDLPKQLVFYLEGPPPGVDILINNVTIITHTCKQIEEGNMGISCDGDENIVQNPQFRDGLDNWSARGCKILLFSSMDNQKILPMKGNIFAAATQRTHNWNGIQQEITGRVRRKLAYEVIAIVRIFGTSSAEVRATLWVQTSNGREQYIGIANNQASDKEWIQLHGKFLLNGSPSKVVIYVEGPPSGTDILLNSLVVKHAKRLPPSSPPNMEETRDMMMVPKEVLPNNIILNHDFSKGLHSWLPNSCDGHVVTEVSHLFNGISAKTGKSYAVISNRTEHWQGLEQNITAMVSPGSTYYVSAWVRICSDFEESSEVQATLRLEYSDSSTDYLCAGRIIATKTHWVKLEGSVSLTDMPTQVTFFLEGPTSGVDLLVDSVTVSSCPWKIDEDNIFGINIINNYSYENGLNEWYPLGPCTLKVSTGSPHFLPSAAKVSLGQHKSLNGQYIIATNRTETWMGPAQTITERMKVHLTYQVSAWVRIGCGPCGPQTVNVALGVDDDWVNGGQVSVDGDRWYELAGSFRIEKKPSKVITYVQGPSSGVDLMVAGFHIFPVNRKERFDYLKKQTDKVRKHDVILKFHGQDSFDGSRVKIRQTSNSFPFGSCISRSNLDNEEFVEFFLKNFNWAVFGNELKWYHTESEQGKFNYVDADEMLEFCKMHGIETRGHCIFWEVKDAIQPWIQTLNITDLMTAIQNRLKDLLTRYKGHFRHYDVNNEMLHGSFYEDMLGKNMRSYMFKAAHQLDPSAVLFVNDYHIEDGRDSKSSPDMYIQQILDLQECGTPIGGIGIQGHISNPVGPIICSALDKLGILGLPIWFTEVDVGAENEHLRADDLEVILREAYSHPAVEGIMLWGFWELFMCREGSHLVNAEGEINEAGRRYLDLKQEWMSNVDGAINEDGEFMFRGFEGTYTVEIISPSNKFVETVVVKKSSDSPLSLNIKVG